MKVFVVDDEVSNCKLLEVYLQKWGYKTEIFSDSIKAYNKFLNEEKAAIAILDWMMPRMNGLEICKKIKSETRLNPFYVILLTAKSDKKDLVEALESGADDYMSKPFDEKELRSRIKVGERIVNLQNNLIKKEKKLENINKKLKSSLNKIKEDEKAGKLVQFKLLPSKKLKYKNFNIEHFLHPSLYLSGDFVDYFVLSDNYIVFFLADVSGHGASSAFITVLLKSFISNHINQYTHRGEEKILNPEELLKELNMMIYNEEFDKYLVMFYGVINIEENSFKYVNAGQYPYPIMFNKKSNFIKQKNLPIGLFSMAEYNSNTIDLPDKFNLFIFSDGIIEILKQDDLKEKEKFLLESINMNSTINELKNKILISEYKKIHDDITILNLKKNKL